MKMANSLIKFEFILVILEVFNDVIIFHYHLRKSSYVLIQCTILVNIGNYKLQVCKWLTKCKFQVAIDATNTN